MNPGSSSGVGVLIDGALHLLEDVVNLDEVILGANVAHGRQRVMLLVRSMSARSVDCNDSRGREVLSGQRARVERKRAMQRHQSLADLRIRRRIEVTALGIPEKFVQGIKCALAGVVLGSSRVVANVVTSTTHGLVVHRARGTKRGCVLLIVAARMTTRVGRLAECSRISTDLTIVIIIARRSFGLSVRPVHAAMLIWGPDQDRVVGVSLDVLLQVLWSLEALAAEVTLVWLQRDMDPDMRGDVISLDGRGAAGIPLASQIQVVGALATNMLLTDVLVEGLGGVELLIAAVPAAGQRIIGSRRTGLRSGRCGRRRSRRGGARGGALSSRLLSSWCCVCGRRCCRHAD